MANDSEHAGWRPCDQHELLHHAQHARKVLNRRKALRLFSASAGLVTIGAAIFYQLGKGKSNSDANQQASALPPMLTKRISCRECIALFQNYRAHNLNSEQTRQVALHLERCPPCKRRFDVAAT